MSFAKESGSYNGKFYEVVTPVHEIDSFNGDAMKKHVETIMGGVDAVFVEFSKIIYLNSSGLRELIMMMRTLAKVDKKLCLLNMREETKKIFMHTNLDRLFYFCSSIEGALEELYKEG